MLIFIKNQPIFLFSYIFPEPVYYHGNPYDAVDSPELYNGKDDYEYNVKIK